MNSIDLIESFSQDVFRTIIRKKYGSDENFDIVINTDRGDLEIWRTREIVKDGGVEDELTQIALTDAIKLEEDYEVGEEAYEAITLDSFGRRAALAAKQTLMSRILELEKDDIFKKYKDRVGDIVSGEVYQIWKREILLLDEEGNELILSKKDQIPSDYFKKGENVRAIIKEVEMRHSNPRILLSRTDERFLAKLMEQEVPEIFDGLITIKGIVREPGERAKVSVESYDDRIDPVGACVGMKGSRIHGIVRELKNENIDIINYTNNKNLYVTRALAPAQINSLKFDDEDERVSVFLNPDQVSKAIGRGGLNIKLASRLTGYEIDVFRDIAEDEEIDIDLAEFSDEIEDWIISEFKNIGCDTAKSILNLDAETLERRTDLEVETIREVQKILAEEFKDEE